MTEAKGEFCGDFKAPRTPFAARSRSSAVRPRGGGKGNPIEGADTGRPGAPRPRRGAEATPDQDDDGDAGARRDDGGSGNGSGNGERRRQRQRRSATAAAATPSKYEAPPQPDRRATTAAATQAPG